MSKWRENQILIPDWTYFYCPGATLVFDERLSQFLTTLLFSENGIYILNCLSNLHTARKSDNEGILEARSDSLRWKRKNSRILESTY